MAQAAAASGGATTSPAQPGAATRIATLDIVRGVAVMGILAMNIVGFAMPDEAYMNPPSFGWTSTADVASWFVSFVFVDGKMRGLFSVLFGASMLLVMQRAEEAGQPSARVHYLRMIWLLVFGLIHYYFIWLGDILIGYALIGMVAWFFHDGSPRALVRIGIALLAIQLLLNLTMAGAAWSASVAAAAPDASRDTIEAWQNFQQEFVIAGEEELAQTFALYRGGLSGIVAHQFGEGLTTPFFYIGIMGWETLAYMLFGMAMLKSGFLAGSLSVRTYARTAAIGFAIGIPLYVMLAWLLLRADFAVPAIFAFTFAATTVVRPVMIVATAALVILVTRHGGALVDRIAAAGRAAFTNYLGTSILMVLLFYGYGLGMFGRLGRAELWLVVIPMWGLMLLWSKAWLDRFLYGPFEWLWRSLARGKPQPMRRRVVEAPGA